MPPKFSLQSVLDYRHKLVELLESELAQILLAQQKARSFLQVLEASQQDLSEKLGFAQQGDIDLFLVTQLRSNLNVITDYIVHQNTLLQDLNSKIEEKQQEIVKARQDEEALKKLSERELERYLDEQALQEKRYQDDAYIARAFRNTLRY